MAAAPGDPTFEATHLRGVRVAQVDSRWVFRVVAAVVLLVLLASTVALTVSGARQNARLHRLHHDGVPVGVTATGCVGISSGVGMGIEYWECRGTYTLGGHSYNQVIRGSRAHLENGQKLLAVAVPGQPGLLSTVNAAAKKYSPWSAYVTPIILGAVTVALIIGLIVWSKLRPPRSSSRTPSGHKSDVGG
jgi:hypothetical protein